MDPEHTTRGQEPERHSAEYFAIEVKNGQLVLTPVRIPRADGRCAKPAGLDLGEQNIAAAVARAR